MKYINWIFVVSILNACSFKKNPLINQTQMGHEELYSEPNKIRSHDITPPIKRVIVASTNDIEGSFSSHQINFKDNHHQSQQIQIGGFDALSEYFKILRDKYKNVILVDSGDIFSTKTDLKVIQKFYTDNKYDALTMGLSDFNLKVSSGITSNTQLIKNFASNSQTPILLSNLYDLKTARVVEWQGVRPYILKETGGVKVGIIGLIPDDLTTLTPINNRIGLYIENMLQSTLRQARLLRSLGADMVVVLTHQEMNCGHEMAKTTKLPLSKINFEPMKEEVCDIKSPLGQYLERLPPQLVDVVIGGRHHQKMANYVNGILVMSGHEHGKSFNYAEFYIDTKLKKVISEKTIVHQPVFICREFFKETKDCYHDDPSVDHKERIPATFLGEPIPLSNNNAGTRINNESTRPISYNEALNAFSADIAYLPSSSGESQLITLKLSGSDLEKILDKEFNNSPGKRWLPSPFKKEKGGLALIINGHKLDPEKNYFILSDLESVQSNWLLKKRILSRETEVFVQYSWNSFRKVDEVNTRMAVQVRQRQ